MSNEIANRFVPFAAGILAASMVLAACGRRDDKPEHGADREAPEAHDKDERDGGHEEEEHHGHEKDIVELSAEAAVRAGVKTASVTRRLLLPVIETTGQATYNADTLVHVSPRVPGRALRVHARLGERIRQGAVLAVLDSIELGQAKAAYLRAKTIHDLARKTYERERDLRAERITSERELQNAEAEFREAAVEVASARKTLSLYGVGAESLESLGFDDPASSHLVVRSPITGTIVEQHVTVGELVTPDKNLFTVADLSEIWITIDVYERDIPHVHLGDGVEVRIDAYPDLLLRGSISYVGDVIDPATRTLRARVDVENREGKLRPGAFVRVRLTDPHARTEPGAPHEVIAVPEGAVQRSGQTFVVFVPLGSHRYREVPVEVGTRSEGYAQVARGLNVGEEVVVEGGFLLKSEAARSELGGGHSH